VNQRVSQNCGLKRKTLEERIENNYCGTSNANMYNSVAKCYAFGAIINVLFFARIIPYIVPGTDADPTALPSSDQGHSVAQLSVKELQICADGDSSGFHGLRPL
jgi:hypothetical protein